jgi:hypothetical protein
MKRLRVKLTYANVMATIAAFLVLAGGTAFAAAQMLPKNSVGAKQLKKGAVTRAKLSHSATAALTGPQGQKGLSGPPGPEGPPGKEGPQGPGAIKIEAAASAQDQVVATVSGVSIDVECNTATTDIAIETPGRTRTLSFFGSVTINEATNPEEGNDVSESGWGGSSVSLDVVARNSAMTNQPVRLDLHVSDSDCKLWGMAIPATAS